MKTPQCVLLVVVIFLTVTVRAQAPLVSNAQPALWIEQAEKSNRKYIRSFNQHQKAAQTNWLTQPSQIEIKKGLYRIRFTQEGLLLADQITIRKVHTDESSNEEVRTLLPAGYYRIEHPQPNTLDVYFSEGANHFFRADAGYILISGIMQKNQVPVPDLIIGSIPYMAQLEKKKTKHISLLESR
jgi:hypothetical protein